MHASRPAPASVRLRRLASVWSEEGPLAVARSVDDAVSWRWRRVRRRLATRSGSATLVAPWAPAVTGDAPPPLVSVLMVARDNQATIGFALRSLQLQKWTAWECVVVDDGSLDNSVEIAQRFVEADNRFRVFARAAPAGRAESWRLALDATRAPIVTFLGGDDMVAPTSIGHRRARLLGSPGAGAVLTEWRKLRPADDLSGIGTLRRARLTARRPHPHGRDASPSTLMVTKGTLTELFRSAPAVDLDDVPMLLGRLREQGKSVETLRSPAVGRRRLATASMIQPRGPGHDLVHEVFARRKVDEVAVAAEFDGAVLLVADSPYHVEEIGPLYDALTRRGIRTRFMESPQTSSAAKYAMARYCALILPFTPDGVRLARAIVVMNDWGAIRPTIAAAHDAGVRTFAKVEGVQDFDDVDTGRVRRPYRTAATILGQGANDVAALPEKTVAVVGSTRLERIWQQPAMGAGDDVLVNLNFTYGVLAHARDSWIESVRSALTFAGRRGVVSCHPAERSSDLGLPVARTPFRSEICRAGALVTRFSTVPFEAIARGVPFIYHNPHGELVPTFNDPKDAFVVTDSAAALADAIRSVGTRGGEDYRSRAETFFRRQVDMLSGALPEERAADVIAAQIREM